MVRMVVFDMAGTTVDEDNVVYKTLQQVINEAGIAVGLDTVLAHGAGKEKLTALRDILAALQVTMDESAIQKMFAHFNETLATAYQDLFMRPQPGANELFAALRQKGIKVVLNTGYNRATATAILQKLNWQIGQDIDELITASDVPQNRPHPDMILLAMQKLSVDDASTVVKVGDSIIDIEEGKNAGCGLCIGITTGAHTEAQLATAHPDCIIHQLMALLPIIENSYAN